MSLQYRIPCLVALIAVLFAWIQFPKLGFGPLVLFSLIALALAGLSVTEKKII